MDGFTYSDIFATKGIEYLVIILFLVLLIPFSVVLNRQLIITRQIKEALGSLSAGVLRIPQGIFYGHNHTWMFLEKSGIAKVGLDDLLMHITGEINFNYLRTTGEEINKGELLTEISHDGKLLQIYSPLTGQIIAKNSHLEYTPGTLNEDPYGNGWIYKIRPTSWKTEIKSCYLGEEATKWSEQELVRFKDFLSGAMLHFQQDPSLVLLQDGGALSDHALSQMPEYVWNRFQQEFLNLYRV